MAGFPAQAGDGPFDVITGASGLQAGDRTVLIVPVEEIRLDVAGDGGVMVEGELQLLALA